MAMIMRLLIGWALTYGLSVLLAVGYDMLTDVDDFSWPMLVFLVTFNLIAFVASAVGVLKLKKPKYIAIGYIVVTLGLFAARIFNNNRPTYCLVYLQPDHLRRDYVLPGSTGC